MQFVIRLMKAMTCATSQSPLGVVIVYLLRMILLLPTAPRLDGDGSTFWSDLSHVLAPITGAVMLRHQKKKEKKKSPEYYHHLPIPLLPPLPLSYLPL